MGRYQTQRGDPETKLFYIVDQLIGGVNTDFSDDTSPDNEFRSIVNFTMDKRGSLYKRMGFGKLDALSQIFNMFERLPEVRSKTPENPDVDLTNDNIVYMKLLVNDNLVFRNLSAFAGDKAYRQYQKVYGFQNNSWSLLMITSNSTTGKSTAWLFDCTLPELNYNEQGEELDEETIIVSSQVYDLPVFFNWNNTLTNIETLEFFDKIYFTTNNKGLVCFDRSKKEFSYSGKGIEGVENGAYKPNAMEIRKVGFNVLGDDPLYWIDYQGLNTNSIQGIYLTTKDNIPINVFPSGGVFRINVLYTGNSGDFDITFKEGEQSLTATVNLVSDINKTGLKVYDVSMQTVPTTEVEIKVSMKNVTLDPYYDYYQVDQIDQESKAIVPLNVGECGICEMYNRAVYYKDDTLWFSEINNFSYVPNYNYVSLPIEPTDKITKVVFFRNVYIIFTKQRIYKMVNSFGSSNFEVLPVNLSVGCHAPNTIAQIENELYFASRRGLYALKSSDFVDGIENLKELDTKVKSLTADITMYVGEIQPSAVRYNGISEDAHAIRYKDKYMLFFNNYLDEDGNYAPVSDIDVLVYQYELKAFSEIRFPIKPTFLFMVDNHILAYGTVPEKEEYTEEEVLFNFDFENTNIVNGKIADSSENRLDATVQGNLVSAPGKGVITNGDESYVKIPDISSKLSDGFNVSFLGDLNNINNAILFQLKQSVPTGSSTPQSFSIYTNWANGYRGELICNTIPNENTLQTTVNYTFRYHRNSTSVNASRSGKFSLVDADGNNLINLTSFNFNFGSALYTDITSGSFVITHDNLGNYSKTWKFTISSEYPTYSTGWDNGPNTSDDVVEYGGSSKPYSAFGIRFQCRTEVFNGGCKVYVKPAFVIVSGASVNIGSRTMYIWIDGNQKETTIPAASGSGYKEFWGSEVSQTLYYNGNKTISIDGRFNMKANIGGTYIANINVDAFNFVLPKSQSYSITNWNAFSLLANYQATLNKIYKASYREISATVLNNNNIKIICNSEYGDNTIEISNSELSFDNCSNILLKFIKNSGDYTLEVYLDNQIFGRDSLPLNAIIDSTRNNNFILKNTQGILNNFSLYISDTNKIIDYRFNEGKGLDIKDYSGNNNNGNLEGNIVWITEKGLLFDGNTGYLILPVLDSNYRFSNGFTLEFESKFDDVLSACRVIDLATGFGITNNDSRCSINVSALVSSNTINFETSSNVNKSYKLSSTEINLKERHKWKFSVYDNTKNYDVNLYCDDQLVIGTQFNYGGITNIIRRSNYIGKSNKDGDKLFKGMLYNLSLKINASASPVPIYVCAMYEYDTTYDDFGRPMEVELETKGLNLQYPMHIKKLKNIFVKGIGGYSYSSFFFELYCDGHLVNDPRVYTSYVDEVTRQIVYDYTTKKDLEFTGQNLEFSERVALLGTMRLDNTRLGEGTYETKKLIVPAKGKNFSVKIYGESDDFLSIESLGFTCKLGKVKEG